MNAEPIDLAQPRVSQRIMPDTLEPMLKGIFDHLRNGAVNRHLPMHTPVVGTAYGVLRVISGGTRTSRWLVP